MIATAGVTVRNHKRDNHNLLYQLLLAEDLGYISAACGELEPDLNHKSTDRDFFRVGDQDEHREASLQRGDPAD